MNGVFLVDICVWIGISMVCIMLLGKLVIEIFLLKGLYCPRRLTVAAAPFIGWENKYLWQLSGFFWCRSRSLRLEKGCLQTEQMIFPECLTRCCLKLSFEVVLKSQRLQYTLQNWDLLRIFSQVAWPLLCLVKQYWSWKHLPQFSHLNFSSWTFKWLWYFLLVLRTLGHCSHW